ncbi:ABC transporter substrate-binding protein [Thioalkalivibrio sp. HK1]|uniref:ABC transporter substrate-binding protein n=1 Tax=Thioalkalivibrio sp. HK1 TaxID=1469245 RepID=UPI0005719F24|nr:ABC transporter substrate-binding protein [Thioalkalivibrio sp. HK1]
MIGSIEKILRIAAVGFIAAGCLAMDAGAATETGTQDIGKPSRIVSVDFCADQFVLELADRRRILALSPDARRSFSYLRKKAQDLPSIRPRAENLIIEGADLVVRSYGGGPNLGKLLAKAQVGMLQVGWAQDLEDIKTVVRAMAKGLGEPERGEALVGRMEARIEAIAQRVAAVRKSRTPPSALYTTPSGTTTGPGSLVHELMVAAGFSNFEARPGWRPLPLERMAYERPDRVIAAFFDKPGSELERWSPMRHSVASKSLGALPLTRLPGAYLACGGWFVLDALETLAPRD